MPRVLQLSGLDKVEHVLAYAAITSLFLVSVKATIGPALILLLLVSTIGVADEVTQPLVSRTADIKDWLADLGGAVGVLLVSMCLRNPKRKTAANSCPPARPPELEGR